ncbi:hypothetical protein Tco_0959272 [Tanacetum coccineum]
METEAIDNQANLVNYDNENEYEIEDLGYESKEYTEDAHEDDENDHSNGYAKRGITRLCKFRMEYGKPGEVKLSRYFDVDLTVIKLVMNRLSQLLRNFRRKLRQTYILPNQDTPSKLNEVLGKYSAILKVKDWVNFVNYTATEEYKVKYAKAKMARSKCVFLHTMGRGKEKGGYARGVGSGVTYKRYFDLPRSRQASDEKNLLLQSQLDNERRERQEKELLIQNLSNKMSQTEEMVTKLKNQLVVQGGQFQSMSTQLTPQNHFHVDSRKLLNLWELSIRLDQSERILQVKIPNPKKMCRYYHKLGALKKTTIIAEGTVYKSDGKIMLHNKALPKDCYKVSIDKSLVDAAFIPDVGSNGCTTVLDAVGGFVAWPKNQVVLDPKAHLQVHFKMITGENKTAPKVQMKRKNVYVSSDAMQKEANKKRSQKALVY